MRSSLPKVAKLLCKMNKFLGDIDILRFTTFLDRIVIFSKNDSEIVFSFFCKKIE